MELCREIIPQLRRAEPAFLQKCGTAIHDHHQILQLCGQEYRCRHNPNRAPARQPLILGGIQGEGIPAIGEAQDFTLGWHQVENKVIDAPATERSPWPAVLLKTPLPQLTPQLVVVRPGNHASLDP